MLRFQHEARTVELPLGTTWTKAKQGESYRDTAEETLRAIIAEIEGGVSWREAVRARYADTHPWLYQIVSSPARALFFRRYPPMAGSRVLDVGAGWGQIALPLAREFAAEVTALEPTAERLAFIRAAATQENVADRMRFLEADFFEVQFGPSFDLICCIGVLEWVPRFRAGDPRATQLDFLRRIRAALRPGGSCCVGIENRLGLKYLLGERDDHTSLRGISVLDASLAAEKHRAATGTELRAFTYTHAEYLTLFQEAGFATVESHAAYPDYKLPQLILPLASPAETNRKLCTDPLPPEHDGIDGHILTQTDTIHSHYRSLAALGIAHYFAPSYFFVLK